MPIPRQKYKELKAMYDFQRKQAYNKEKVRKAVEIMFDNHEVIFDYIWAKMTESEMHYVPLDWIPEDDDLKIEGEE